MLKFIFKKPVGFFLLAIVLVGVGLVTVSQLPLMMYPQTRRPQVQIDIKHPGISAVDFQDQYANRIEPRLLSLDGLDKIETTYSTDSSSFALVFDWEIQSDAARTGVENLMVTINATLPEEIKDGYTVRSRDGENAGYLVMGLTSPTIPAEELYQILKTNLEPRLNQVGDVEELGLYSTQQLIVDLILDQPKLLAYGLTIQDVNAALQSGFVSLPLGSMNTSDGRLSIRLQRNGRSLQELPRLEVKKVGDSSIKLVDIALLNIRYTLPRRVFLVEDKPAVQLTATPVEGGNVNAMTSEILAIVNEAKESGRIPQDTVLHMYLDPAKYIQRSIDNVVQAALIGGILAILVVFLVLGELRNTLIIAASLPVSIIFSFIFMGLFGISLNLISLGGLALAVGMIVDSTIVVMENIHRLRHECQGPMDFVKWRKIVLSAVAQVRGPVIASTLTSVLVFLPISFTAPLTNAILGDQARTVVFALVGAMAVSLTVVPLVAYYLFRSHDRKPQEFKGMARITDGAVKGMVGVYRKILQWLVKRKRRSVAFLGFATGLLVLAILFILPLIPREIISKPTSDRVVLFFRNSAITKTEDLMKDVVPEMSRKINEALGELMVRKFTSLSGRFNQTFVDLRSSKDTEEAITRLQSIFVSEGDWFYNVLAWDPAALPLPNSFDLQVSVYGPDPTKKIEILTSIQALLNEENFYRRVFTRPSASITSELGLTPRAETIGRLAPWTEASLAALIRRVLAGTSEVTLSDGLQDVTVTAAYPPEQVDGRQKLEEFLIPWRQSFVSLKHFFDFSVSQGVSQVYSEDGEPVYRIYGFAGFQVSDTERLDLQTKAHEFLDANLVLPDGYSITYDNPRVEMDESISSLFIALAISIVLIYLLLAFQFNSLWIPVVILVTIPLGLTGVIVSLWIFGSTLNLNSLLGTILLGGLVVNNAIIMIDFFLVSRHQYKTNLEALVATAAVRFQPILITTLTTIFGMLPLAIGMGEGSNILQPLGIAVSGGLLISTLFTLLAVPALLSLTQKEGQFDPSEGGSDEVMEACHEE